MTRTSPAPHRTERTDFPYSALRTHSSSSLPCRCNRQRIESIVGVQSLGWVPLPQSLRATLLAPAPPARPVFTVLPQVAHHCRAIPEMEVARPAAQRPVGFRHHFANGSPQGPVIEEALQRLPHCGSAFGIGFHMQLTLASA